MIERLIKKKNKALKILSRKEYYQYVNFIGEIYVADYDLKVFMARKFSNHYISLLELAIEENGGKVEDEYKKMMENRENEPITISNNALPFIKYLIKNKKIKKVLLIDDLVLHGRTLDIFYRRIKEWMTEAGINDPIIDVWSFAKSEDGLIDSESMKKLRSKEDFQQNDWRKMSNQIVDLFYMLEQPYTSYVPNYRSSIDSDEGKKFLHYLSGDNPKLGKAHYSGLSEDSVTVYTYNEPVQSDLITTLSVRLYYFDKRDYVFVPMVTLKPLEEDMIFNILSKCRKWIDNDKLIDSITSIKEQESKEDKRGNRHREGIESLYRLVVYVLSSLYGWLFMYDEIGIKSQIVKYDDNEEKYNFNGNVLNYSDISIDMIRKSYKEIFNIKMDFDRDSFMEICQKADTVGSLINYYQSIEKIDLNIKEEKDFDFARYRMECFLNTNGDIDEESYIRSKISKEESITPRYEGVPVYWLIDAGLTGETKEKQFDSLLYVTDKGKGSVVPMTFDKWILPFLHAGEQNYQFYEDYYFDYIYGIYNIEKIYDDIVEIKDKKEDFTSRICEEWDKSGKVYSVKDINRIKKMDILNEYSNIFAVQLKKYCASDENKIKLQKVNELIYG